MNEIDPQQLSAVRRALLLLLPDEALKDRIDDVAELIAHKLSFEPDRAELDMPHFVELVVAGWNLRASARPADARDEKIGREVRRRVRELIAGLDAICWPEGSETTMPFNKFIVTRYHDSISIPEFKVSQLDPKDARNLGVWLIALADPTLKDAARELLSVMTR